MTDAAAELPTPPDSFHRWTGFSFGRYRGAFAEPVIEVEGLRRYRLKEWHYLSVVTERHFVALGLVQLGYLAQLFAYVVDRRIPSHPWEAEILSPLGRGLHMAPSSIRGVTTFRRGADRVNVAYQDGFHVDLALSVDGRPLVGSLRFEDAPGLSLVYPLGPKRPAYTHKAAGMRVEGDLRFGDDVVLGAGVRGFGVSDWTRSLADRETTWKWASFAGSDTEGRVLGLNLSSEVYDDPEGNSQENALFVGGEVQALGGVRFVLPADPRAQAWEIRSRHGREVELRFVPLGAREQNLQLGVIGTRFVQPYGTFHGRVLDHRIDGAFGVVEDHRSLW
jgi:hypothetical protein